MSGSDEQDDWLVDDEAPGTASARTAAARPWKILIVDDDAEVHAVTRLVLGDSRFQDRPLLFLSAHSGAEARTVIQEHRDLAVILLDVVMETEDAGLRLARFIREEAHNPQVRIILRTGQPGQAPERAVIDGYEIDDYKAKGELTADRLYTAVKTALRSYRQIMSLEASRQGLERIIDASATLMEKRSMESFVAGVAMQLRSLIDSAEGVVLCSASEGGGIQVQAAAGSLAAPPGEEPGESPDLVLPPPVSDAIRTAIAERRNIYADDHCVIVFHARTHVASVVCLSGHDPLSDLDRNLLEIFCSRAAIGFDNVYLFQQLLSAQKATVHALGKLAEYKDEVTGDHVRRIASTASAVAAELRARGLHGATLDDTFMDSIGLASVLHDVGKVAVPDRVLMKPGPLDAEEMELMRTHAAKGGALLHEAAQFVDGASYLTLGAVIAESHHEKFDGTGYPRGLSGEDIPLAGRIVAVADVFDALIHPRPYKPAWPREKALAYIQEQAGRHFDPAVVEAFLAVTAARL